MLVSRFLTVVIALASFSIDANAQQKTINEYLGDSWLNHFYKPFAQNLGKIQNYQGLTPEDQRNCDQFYSRIRQKGELKILLGVGYYDSSEGPDYVFDFYPDGSHQLQRFVFGMNATMDIAYDVMYRKLFKLKCVGNQQLCEFTETQPGVFTKWIKDPQGQTVRAVIEMKTSSVSHVHADNVGRYAAEQQAKSDEATRWFFNSIPSADLVIYNGHSRKGGGPDFHPPKLRSNLHVDYSYYLKNTPGLKRLLTALKNPSQPAALWMMSCDSTKLFSAAVAKVAPRTAFVGTTKVIPGDITTKGAIAGMDAMLRFQCQAGINRELHSAPDVQSQLSLPVIK